MKNCRVHSTHWLIAFHTGADDAWPDAAAHAGPLREAHDLAVPDEHVRADVRAHVVRAERGAVVPADDGEAKRGAFRSTELHAHSGPDVLEGALRGAELRPDDGRALVEHADEASEHVRAELRPVAAALVLAAADARTEL